MRALVVGFSLAMLPVSVVASAFVPIMAWSSPKPFLGLDDGFSKQVDDILFLPGLHPCGALSIISLTPNLRGADLEVIQTLPALATDWKNAGTRIVEELSLETQVLAWAKGWRAHCGPTEADREVRVTKLNAEGLDEGPARRQKALSLLDTQLRKHLSGLPPPPHNHVVFISSLSPAIITKLFDYASSTIPNQPSTPPAGQRGFFSRLFFGAIKSFFWSLVFAAAVYLAHQAWVRREELKRQGRVRLPFNNERNRWSEDRELDLDAE